MGKREGAKRVAVFTKPHPEAAGVLRRIAACLANRGIEMISDPAAAASLGNDDGVEREQAADGACLVVALGGDGTLLAAARAVGAQEIPILGVNLGHLGFLTETRLEEIEPVLGAALDGTAPIDRRAGLAVYPDGPEPAEPPVALNDVVVSARNLARLFTLLVEADGERVTEYRADGLILATPTGSTAYNLSAGGPLVLPAVDALVATPICPHSLSQRPLIFSGDTRLEVTLAAGQGDIEVQVTVDGQIGFPLDQGKKIVVHRAPHPVLLVRPPDRSYFSVLRDKLSWGRP